ncbi:MAG TPA: penicillin-binding transpeptidase domain-containing protein [Solirubrobacteraceae bacterium]|jgi:penicillin-binding protein 2|nr:penicillin-binding transpeptidase domain-containing protein [Solirubrobacteraceae bacterium]
MNSLERVRTPDRTGGHSLHEHPRFGQRVPPPGASQLGLRVAILGGVALIMFGIIFFRLWYLQILSGEQYVQQAAANTLRDLPIVAPRGQILDREGNVLVTSRVTNAVQIVPSELPPAGPGRRALYRRLGGLLGMSPRRIVEIEEKGHKEVSYAPVTIKTDAGRGVLTVLGERQDEYPGVKQEQVSVRRYPDGEMAAQMFGYVSQVTKEEKEPGTALYPHFKGVETGTMVGQEGLEYQYDRYLRGTPGVRPVEVNSENQVVANKPVTKPRVGYSLRLTLDLPLQREGEVALRKGMELARALGHPGNGAAFLAMEPRSGQILASGSYPSFDPNRFVKPLTESELKEVEQIGKGVEGAREPDPLLDRATEGHYPTGSTFKPITAIGSLEAGLLDPNVGMGAGSCIVAAGGQKFCNAGNNDYGAVGLVAALKVSSDTYFFEVGEHDNGHNPPAIQAMAHKLGIGRPTGIDLPNESEGVLPSPAWREDQNRKQAKCLRHPPRVGCGYVAEIRPWEPGDNMDLAVGQGDLQTDPLQMAVAYSTLANAFMGGGEGTVPTPHVGMAIENPSGGIVQTLNFPPRRKVKFNDANLNLVMEGIHDATFERGGTSADVWSGWNQAKYPVYGKTGTAERAGQVEQAWYMCILPDANRPIVIAVTVEQGGFGDQAAAPVARLIASKWFNQPLKLMSGSNADH